MTKEVELKLDLTAGDADAFEASGLPPGDPKIVQQRSVYFDTPDQALAKAGHSLRIRSSGRKHVQTVKAEGASAAGLFDRSEWERAVTGSTPVLDNTTPIQALLGERTSELAPAFEVVAERRTWIVEDHGAIIEMVLDRGEAIAGDRRSPICEIELELKSGDPSAIFALARRIDAVAAVRLGVLTKAERGYRLAGPVSTAHKAERITLTGSMTTASAFQRIVQSCIRQFRLNETVLLTEPNAEALHQARVALRRLRSAFSIFKSVIHGKIAAHLRDELRWLAAQLGEARNIDVLLDRARAHGWSIHNRLEKARDAAYDRVDKALKSPRVRSLMLDLAQWAAEGDWLDSPQTAADRSERVSEFAASALDRLRRRVKKDGRHLAKASDAERHEVRKDAKKLRYATEFFRGLFTSKDRKKRYKAFTDALEELQDQLGALNDLATAPETFAKLGMTDEPDAASFLSKGKKSKLLAAASGAHDDLVATARFW